MADLRIACMTHNPSEHNLPKATVDDGVVKVKMGVLGSNSENPA
jgi:hypothetical protein